MNKRALRNSVFVLSITAAIVLPRCLAQEAHQEHRGGAEIIGKKAAEFEGLTWINTKSLSLSSLRGHPVFVRFWSGGCSYCQKSIPALNYLHEAYSAKGLVVIAIHHPKGIVSLKLAENVESVMHQWGMNMAIPVALDNNWKTIRRLWLNNDRQYTSASILIDKEGIIRWVHPGGVLALPPDLGGAEDSPAFESLERAINESLK